MTKGFVIASSVVWFVSWLLLWMSAEWGKAGWIFEPAVVGLTLGLVALMSFAAIYFAVPTETLQERLRSAIAGSVVLLFLLLVVDLLTIAGFRESLSELNASSGGMEASAEDALTFVEGIFDTFKWVVIAVVGFYFGAGAAEAVGNNIQASAEARAEADVQIAQATAQPPPGPAPGP
jgi:hypothetical protein